MNGKSRCKILKEIRKQIALNNDIEFVVSECKYKGDCLGTCPKCEQELRYLEAELLKRRREGKKIAVAGIAAALIAASTGCSYEGSFMDQLISDLKTSEPDYSEGLMGMVADPNFNNDNSDYWADDTEVSSQILGHPDIHELLNMSEQEALHSICRFRGELQTEWREYLTIEGLHVDTYEFEKDGVAYRVEVEYDSKTKMIGVTVTQLPPESSSDFDVGSRTTGVPM